MGFFPLGVAFGMLAKSMGVSAFIAMALSMLGYGGAAQFMMLSLFSVGTSYVEVFIVSYLVNLRHTFYGISLLNISMTTTVKSAVKLNSSPLVSVFIKSPSIAPSSVPAAQYDQESTFSQVKTKLRSLASFSPKFLNIAKVSSVSKAMFKSLNLIPLYSFKSEIP